MPTSLSLALNPSNDLFSGLIPWCIGDLDHLEILDLSDNRFTCKVPCALTKMENLTLWLLSDNHLSGTLLVFQNWVTVVIMGNNFTGDNTTSNKDRGTTKTSIDKQAILAYNHSFCEWFCCCHFRGHNYSGSGFKRSGKKPMYNYYEELFSAFSLEQL